MAIALKMDRVQLGLFQMKVKEFVKNAVIIVELAKVLRIARSVQWDSKLQKSL